MSRFALAALVLVVFACASTIEEQVLPADEQYAQALKDYEEGEYAKAIAAFRTFTFNYPQDQRVVDARWFTAEAYYESEDWATAAQEYLNFQRDFPREGRADDSLYQAGQAYQHMSLRPELDQGDTRRAVGVLDRLLTEYPASELAAEARERRGVLRNKLAEKVYLNAEFYFDNEDYKAAEIYLVDLIENHADSDWLPAGYALLASTLCEQGLMDRASTAFTRLEESFPDSDAFAEASDRLPERCRERAAPAARAGGVDGER